MDAGPGSQLPLSLLLVNVLAASLATSLSFYSIALQVKNYRKALLQRHVVRILVMVPIYAMASVISLSSLSLAFFIDALRDIYEAFVIYSFFQLLTHYLGGERSLLIMAHGRAPVPHPRPMRWFIAPMDISDPFTFLSVKRGILQFVYLKPILTLLTMILKTFDKYGEGDFAPHTGYFWISLVYNVSVALSLYALAMFWLATHDDLLPFRPVPKFLCVKGIIFFSFWQGFTISILVALGWIHSTTNFTSDNLSLALQDIMICLEMPFFAILHLYAFSHTDYFDPTTDLVARMPAFHAFKDAFGMKDVLIDSRNALKGTGFSYRTFEPAEGSVMHAEGFTRDKRVKAGLRYARGGRGKYWVEAESEAEAESEDQGRMASGGRYEDRTAADLIHAPANTGLLFDPKNRYGTIEAVGASESDPLVDRDGRLDSELAALRFDPPDELEERLFHDARKLVHGDFNYPAIDTGREEKRRARGKRRQQAGGRWEPEEEEEDGIDDGRADADAQLLPDGCVDVIVKQKDRHQVHPSFQRVGKREPGDQDGALHGDDAGRDRGESGRGEYRETDWRRRD